MHSLQEGRSLMKRKLLSALLIASSALFLLSGCGKKEKDTAEIKVHATKSELEDGHIYVRHKDGTFDEVYPGENDKAKKTGIFWFKSDFKKIPHLVQGQGDTLVYYSTQDMEEKFEFKRYYDLGYTVGICGLTPDKNTGRYTISTKKDDMNTYPGSDADELLNTANDNKTATIASIGGKELRRKVVNDDHAFEDDSEDSDSESEGSSDSENLSGTTEEQTVQKDDKVSSEMVTKYGTIKNLKQNGLYTLLTYNGSVRKSVNLRANVRAMGYAGSYTSTSYVYGKSSDTNLITIGIPNWFNTGYYTIQTDKTTVGMFALVNESSYNDNTDFNNPNMVPESEEDKAQTDVDDDEENSDGTTEAESFDNYMNLTFKESGYTSITFTIDNMTDEEAQQMEGFKAGFFTDGGRMMNFSEKSPGVYTVAVEVTSGTSYKVGYSGLPAALADRAVLNYQFLDQ